MKSSRVLFACVVLSLCVCAFGCQAKSAKTTADAAASDAKIAQVNAAQSAIELKKSQDAANAALAALQANPTDSNLQLAAKSAQTRLDAANVAASDTLTALARANVVATDAASRYEKALASDDQFWNSAAGVITLVGGSFGVGGLGGLVGLIRGRFVGQTQGATIATTAITNADKSDALQSDASKTALANNLVGQPANIVAAVHAAI